ncbi:MAG: uroporphyrinogen-III synthase [Saprospiraceae bacterium]|nr:uroporphyrinogen-III synthase [Saprospiraceae bacterium]
MKIFISRELQPDSEFLRRLAPYHWAVETRTLLQLKGIPFQLPPNRDWIFFSSKNGVAFFFEGLDVAHWTVPSVHWACIGSATAEALQQRGITPDFVGTGDPETTAALFKPKAQGQKVLFVGALHARAALRLAVQQYAQTAVLAVYDNQALPAPELSEADVLIFTSPLNATSYFGKNALLAHQQLVAIGNSTAQCLQELGFSKIRIPENPSETALAQLLLQEFASA